MQGTGDQIGKVRAKEKGQVNTEQKRQNRQARGTKDNTDKRRPRQVIIRRRQETGAVNIKKR